MHDPCKGRECTASFRAVPVLYRFVPVRRGFIFSLFLGLMTFLYIPLGDIKTAISFFASFFLWRFHGVVSLLPYLPCLLLSCSPLSLLLSARRNCRVSWGTLSPHRSRLSCALCCLCRSPLSWVRWARRGASSADVRFSACGK